MTTGVRELFAQAAATYDRGSPVLKIERAETEALLPALVGLDVMDLGAGTGRYARVAHASGARTVIAIDFTLEMLKGAPRPAVLADAAQLPIRTASIDVVIAAMMISFVRDCDAVMGEVSRVLRPGGVLVLSDLHPIAADLGWQRTFMGPSGERLKIDAPPLAIAQLTAGLASAGLTVESLREPAIDRRLEADFRRAGRRDFASLAGTPLLVVIRARKEGARV